MIIGVGHRLARPDGVAPQVDHHGRSHGHCMVVVEVFEAGNVAERGLRHDRLGCELKLCVSSWGRLRHGVVVVGRDLRNAN